VVPQLSRALTLFVVFTFLPVDQGAESLTNENVVSMVQAKATEDSIVELIENATPSFDTSGQALLELHRAGVSQRIIAAMLLAARRAALALTSLPDEVGVYVKREGHHVRVEPERVEWSEEWFRWSRARLYTRVADPRSQMSVVSPVEFLIVCPIGGSAAEYGLLRAEDGEPRSGAPRASFRVFSIELNQQRLLSGRLWNDSQKSPLAFKAERLSPRKYWIRDLELEEGEYAFLPPGQLLGNKQAQLYTFRVF